MGYRNTSYWVDKFNDGQIRDEVGSEDEEEGYIEDSRYMDIEMSQSNLFQVIPYHIILYYTIVLLISLL